MNVAEETLRRWLDPKERERAIEDAELEEMLDYARMPSIQVVKTPAQALPGALGCWLGGAPSLPTHITWPWVVEAPTPEKVRPTLKKLGLPIRDEPQQLNPMNFIGQFDLAQLPRVAGMPDLPTSGTLFFFADFVRHVERSENQKSCAVIYVEDDVSGVPARAHPEWPANFEPIAEAYWWNDNPATSFERWNVTFQTYDDYDYERFPNTAYWQFAIKKSVETGEWLRRRAHRDQQPQMPTGRFEELQKFGKRRKEEPLQHRFFGPSLLHPDESVIRLFSIQTDSDLGFSSEWLGFFLRPDDLAARRFDKAFAFTENC